MRQLCRYAEVIKAIKQRYGNEGADTYHVSRESGRRGIIRRSGGNNLSLGWLVTRTVSREPEHEYERTSARAHEHAKNKGQKPEAREAWRLRKSENQWSGGALCDTTCCHGRLTHGHTHPPPISAISTTIHVVAVVAVVVARGRGPRST
jgi:hypothetical protein